MGNIALLNSLAVVLRDIARYLLKQKAACVPVLRKELSGRIGLEIGGPSYLFGWSYPIPIYALAERMDNAAFAQQTVWAINNATYKVARHPGHTFVCDAAALEGVPPQYDFVAASHVLEHIANPIKALHAWTRVLKPNGLLIVLVPDMRRTFDHRRPLTTVEHMVSDFERDIREDDLSHLEEIVSLHDYAMHNPCGSPDGFRSRGLDNFTNRCLHHHTFTQENLRPLLEFAGIRVEAVEFIEPNNLLAIGLPANSK